MKYVGWGGSGGRGHVTGGLTHQDPHVLLAEEPRPEAGHRQTHVGT